MFNFFNDPALIIDLGEGDLLSFIG